MRNSCITINAVTDDLHKVSGMYWDACLRVTLQYWPADRSCNVSEDVEVQGCDITGYVLDGEANTPSPYVREEIDAVISDWIDGNLDYLQRLAVEKEQACEPWTLADERAEAMREGY